MIILPYSGTLGLARRPYVAFGVMLLCLLVHLLAVQRESTVTEEIARYCDRAGHSLRGDTDSQGLDRIDPFG